MVEESLTAITIIVGLATAAISTFTIYYRKKQYEVANKQYNMDALLSVFQLLNNEIHRAARQAVYKYYRDRLDKKNSIKEEQVSEQIAMVRSDFDTIGALIRNRLLSQDLFFDAFWDTTLICWNALEEDIHDERRLRQNQNYMANFEYLASQARQYKEKYLPRESVEPY
jgi:hypothetical protein